jgi:hypothetical protein
MTPTEMHIDALMEKIEKLEAENSRLREALEYYSIPNKTDEFASEDFGPYPYEDSDFEEGHIAREALKGGE